MTVSRDASCRNASGRINDSRQHRTAEHRAAFSPGAAGSLCWLTQRWSKGDSNPRSLLLDFRDEGQVQGGVARTSIKIFPNRSRFAVEPGGTTQVESYSSMMQGPALGTRRSERFIIAVSHQPWSGPK